MTFAFLGLIVLLIGAIWLVVFMRLQEKNFLKNKFRPRPQGQSKFDEALTKRDQRRGASATAAPLPSQKDQINR